MSPCTSHSLALHHIVKLKPEQLFLGGLLLYGYIQYTNGLARILSFFTLRR